MTMNPLTFEEFQSEKALFTIPQAADWFGTSPEDFGKATAAYLYPDDLFIEIHEDGHQVLIGNQQWTGSLEELEARLYHEVYLEGV